MIKNLLLACGMTLLPYQPLEVTAPSTSAEIYEGEVVFENTPWSKTNVYTYTYYNDDNLSIYRENSTINFNEQIKTNIGVKQRAVLSVNRDIEGEEYQIVYNILINIDTTLDREDKPTNLIFNIYTPEETSIYNKTYSLYSLSALTTKQTEFLNGANYNSYNDIPTFVDLTANGTQQQNDTFNGNTIQIETSNYTNLLVSITLNYDEREIISNGQNLLNNQNIVTSTRYIIEYKGYINPSQYEVIDLPGIMFDILGMPFAWLSIAFDFTLFPGTQYAINISHILLGLIVSLIAIIIFKQLMKGR